ncbi:MAG: amino acid ABC transporter permease/ATP-binding protein [Castellaniella sp.]
MDFDWTYAASLFWEPDFWWACLTVAELSISAWLIAGIIGFVLALAKQSEIRPLNWSARAYIWFFRSLPLLVLLVFVYNLPQIFPASGAVLTSPFAAGLIALILSETAYMAEIHRGGILSVSRGQYEAGKALGIGYGGIQRLIVIPQAIRIALPTLSNQFITIVKLTSLVSVISLTEILLVGQRLYTQNFLIFETMLAVAFYYVLVVTLFDRVLHRLENGLDITLRKPDAFEPSQAELRDIAAAQTSDGATAQAQSTAGNAPIMEVRRLNKHYGSHHALKDINLTVQAGDVISIIGASGSGKTSLIRTLNGLETMDSGTVLVHGRSFLGEHHEDHERAHSSQILDIGMVFQSFNLFPHKTALDNVLVALNYHQREGSATQRRLFALAQLKKVGLLEHANKYPHQLSGGQQQRVAIARALAMRPSIILLDEPTSALDPDLVNEVLRVLEQLVREGMTMLIVTHEMQFAFSVSNRILVMRDGAIAYDASPDALRSIDDQRLRDFLHQVM